YGFPYKLTEELAQEQGIRVDDEAFGKALEEQRRKSQGGSNIERDVFAKAAQENVIGADVPRTGFRGYEDTHIDTSVVALYQDGQIVQTARAGDNLIVVLEQTPFYAESGGIEGRLYQDDDEV